MHAAFPEQRRFQNAARRRQHLATLPDILLSKATANRSPASATVLPVLSLPWREQQADRPVGPIESFQPSKNEASLGTFLHIEIGAVGIRPRRQFRRLAHELVQIWLLLRSGGRRDAERQEHTDSQNLSYPAGDRCQPVSEVVAHVVLFIASVC